MVALKANDVDAFVARPNPERPIVLLFGPDAGLVHERAEKLINASVDDPSDPFALVRIEGDALASEPSRLVEEAHTVPLFGGRRAVWIKAGSRNFAAAVEAVVASPPVDCRIVIEAGDLKRNAPLRAICEKAKSAAVLPCYADNERDLDPAHRRRDARRQAHHRARRARRARVTDRRRSPGVAERDPQARTLCPRQGSRRAGRRDRGRRRRLGAGARRGGRRRLRRARARYRGAVLQGAGRRHVVRLDHVVGAALRHATAQGAGRARCRRGHLHRDAKLHAADAFLAAPTLSKPRWSWTAPRLERAMEQLAEAALNVRRTASLADSLAQRALLSLAVSARRKER